MSKPCSILLGLVCLLAISLASTGAVAAADSAGDWTLGTADGGTVSFQDALARGPVVVSFWATWCKPCLKEMPHLNQFAGEFAGQVTFLAVNTDNSKSVAKVAPFLAGKNYDNLIVPLDTGGTVQSQLQVGGTIPFLVMYDAAGREVYSHVGYKPGDEVELKHAIDKLLAEPNVPWETTAVTGPDWSGVVAATDKFKYSYSSETDKEIFDNWLDISYQFGGFRTGVMFRSEAPSEFGDREHRIEHRFFEFDSGEFSIRAGHFFGIFGRGLVFNSYEDRVVRVDTRLDGVTATWRRDGLTATMFSGSPSVQPVDVRGLDSEYSFNKGLKVGVTGLTYRPDDHLSQLQEVNREWFYAARLRQNFAFGDYYLEYGLRTLDVTEDYYSGLAPEELEGFHDDGEALYANVNLYQGPFSASWERSYYKRYAVVPNADGKTALNRPPSLTREFTWTLMNRDPHNLDQTNERGHNLDLMFSEGDWTAVASGARLKQLSGETVYELAYGSLQKDHVGPFKFTGGFGYQEAEDLRQTVVGEVTWKATENASWTLQAEHQHVRLDGGYGYTLGAFDNQWFKLEYEQAPSWAVAVFYETSNKSDDQRPSTEKEGPFPAAQITYTLSRGGNLNLWAGKRQAGYLCSGGVCKFEPAFEGVEFYGLFRY
jgi:cytochrome c biogenesis protein CcmG/thiol:disulfide interchange protein DsbE